MPKSAGRPPRQKKAKVDSTPQTADDFLAIGVEFEEAGEKWRAGDAVKSARFFRRAIDNYDAALSRFPHSFDIAYNKARVQYQITQYPKLAAQMSAPQVDLLRVALQSHRAAERLRLDHVDALFNTAQVLTSLAEALLERRAPGQEPREAISLLEEAVDRFQRCLLIQEQEYAASQNPSRGPSTPDDTDMQGEHIGDTASSTAESEQWAMIVEPVTLDTVLDIVLAQLEALRTMCGAISSDASISDMVTWIERTFSDNLETRLSRYTPSDPARHHEVALVRANFTSSLAEAKFRAGRLDVVTYQQTLERVYTKELDVLDDPAGLCDHAEALTSFSSALGEASGNGAELSASDQSQLDSMRWNALSTTLESLTRVSKHPSAANVARIHLARGDAEMLRLQIGRPPGTYDLSQRSRATLLKNAQVAYRGAVGYARSGAEGDQKEEELEGLVKEGVSARIEGNAQPWERLRSFREDAVRRVIAEAQAEGVIPPEWQA